MMRTLAACLLCAVLLSSPVAARQQVAGPAGAAPPAPAGREHLANTRALPLSRLLGLCGEVKRMFALERELGTRPPTRDDIQVVSNATKCLAATAAIFETIRAMEPLYGERVVCIPSGVRDQDLLEGMLQWLEERDRQGGDDIFRLAAPRAFIIYIRQAYPCGAGQ
ncbi:exported protein of unknown function [Magnetospirillum sp. XM-1]|uniref:hypothetical protein n=1 Tax=Magnetospirillum sp. XM-1 TaxID=1663591 RepID=UPI00073E09B0|nr:hypothetical protein [Magnetospirillum sp. XM-1]CUW39587.1 exported protein of unknown function [Magnetospirillum sp. XM-1]